MSSCSVLGSDLAAELFEIVGDLDGVAEQMEQADSMSGVEIAALAIGIENAVEAALNIRDWLLEIEAADE